MIKWWILNKDNAKVFAEKVVKEARWEMTLEAEDTWTKMKTCIFRIAKDNLGDLRGSLVVKKRIQRGGMSRSRQK